MKKNTMAKKNTKVIERLAAHERETLARYIFMSDLQLKGLIKKHCRCLEEVHRRIEPKLKLTVFQIYVLDGRFTDNDNQCILGYYLIHNNRMYSISSLKDILPLIDLICKQYRIRGY